MLRLMMRPSDSFILLGFEIRLRLLHQALNQIEIRFLSRTKISLSGVLSTNLNALSQDFGIADLS